MKAIFSAGCFWGVQQEFKKIKGVISATAGYTGGKKPDPSYEQVSTGATGHVESVLIEYSLKIVSYEKLLEVFWKIHDPTSFDKQGPDIGSQYKAIIFYLNKDQKRSALKSLRQQQKKYKKKIRTKILKAKKFYPAEEYHQNYLDKIKF
jgi:peptide-methionine (S)-S-oxide reductase